MHGLRYDRILASTALALILAAPLGASAAPQRPAGKLAAAPTVAAPSTTGAVPSAAAPTDQPAAVPSEAPAAPKDATTPATPTAPAAATEQAAAPDPMAALDPADRAVAEKIRDLFAVKTEKGTEKNVDKIFSGKKERAAVEAFYQARSFAPLWLDKGVESARGTATIARISAADADGLEPKDYKIPMFAGLGPDALAEADLKLTQTVLTYARHVQAGRFPYSRISHNNFELPQAPPDTTDVLTRVTTAADAAKALDEFSPPLQAYKRLKVMLAEMRGKVGGGTKDMLDGQVLKPSTAKAAPMEDSRVPLLREKLGLPVTGDVSDLKYDAKVVEAVKRFQKGVELPATGIIDAKTIKELNGPAHDKQIDLVIANMERWRWYPRDLGKAHVIVNQPEFVLRVYHNDAQVWTTRVVIGKAGQQYQTPLLNETMKYITINPTWNVPPSIVQNEYLPALRQDPTVLERMGLKVVNERDGSVHIYQPPGEANALGRIRFNFPNRFLVYQHDTPDKHLFADSARAYSHGCMRVQDPAKYAEVLFNIARPSENWSAERIKRMFGTGEQDVQLPVPIWVHLTYQSALVDDNGKLQVFRDVYGLDSRTIAAIKSERGVVEPMQERKKEQEVASGGGQRRTVMAQQPRTVSFFESLFGGGRSFQPAPQPPRAIRR